MSETEKKIGISFTQIVAILTIIASIFLAYQSMSVKIVAAEIRITVLEKNGTENREDHIVIMNKLDELIKESRK
jgi:hypothetical protein